MGRHEKSLLEQWTALCHWTPFRARMCTNYRSDSLNWQRSSSHSSWLWTSTVSYTDYLSCERSKLMRAQAMEPDFASGKGIGTCFPHRKNGPWKSLRQFDWNRSTVVTIFWVVLHLFTKNKPWQVRLCCTPDIKVIFILCHHCDQCSSQFSNVTFLKDKTGNISPVNTKYNTSCTEAVYLRDHHVFEIISQQG